MQKKGQWPFLISPRYFFVGSYFWYKLKFKDRREKIESWLFSKRDIVISLHAIFTLILISQWLDKKETFVYITRLISQN